MHKNMDAVWSSQSISLIDNSTRALMDEIMQLPQMKKKLCKQEEQLDPLKLT